MARAVIAKGRPRLKPEARREQLLDAAIEVLIERGVNGVTMEGIAAKAGVNKALPYRHFDNAHAVLVELFIRFNTVLGGRVLTAVEENDDVEGRVTATVHAYFDVLREHEVLLSMVLVPGLDVADEAGRALDAPTFIVNLMVDAFGVPRPMARATGEVVLGILAAAAQSWAGGAGSRRKLEQLATGAILGAIGAR